MYGISSGDAKIRIHPHTFNNFWVNLSQTLRFVGTGYIRARSRTKGFGNRKTSSSEDWIGTCAISRKIPIVKPGSSRPSKNSNRTETASSAIKVPLAN